MNPSLVCEVLGYGLPRGKVMGVFSGGGDGSITIQGRLEGTSGQIARWSKEIRERCSTPDGFTLAARDEPIRLNASRLGFWIYLTCQDELIRHSVKEEHQNPVCQLSLQSRTQLAALLGVSGFDERSGFQKVEQA
jgi:hypothetical protein